MKALVSLLAATLLLPACMEEPGPESASAQSRGDDCFHANSVSGFTPRGDEVVDIQVGANRHYRLELGGICPGIDWSHRIILRTRGGGSFICRGMDAEVIAPDRGMGPERCWVTGIRRLSEAEVEAARRD